MIVDFRRKKEPHTEIIINNEIVENVSQYKYLGVTFDEKLEWHPHARNVQCKINQRMFFVRKLNEFHIDNTIIHMFYRSTLLSVISFRLTAWGGNVHSSYVNKFNTLFKKIAKITKMTPDTFSSLFKSCCHLKLLSIMKDESHPLFHQIKYSSRSGRILHLKANRERYKNSFMPSAIRDCHNIHVSRFLYFLQFYNICNADNFMSLI